jgi:hypothetical protein
LDIHSILLTWWQARGSASLGTQFSWVHLCFVLNESILGSVCTVAVCNEQLFHDYDSRVPELWLITTGEREFF